MTIQHSLEPGIVYTIGHSNHAFSRFAELLTQDRIDVLADTRSHPRSQFAPQFNQDALRDALAEHGVKYRFLGVHLGGRPADPDLYDSEGHALYSKIAQTSLFRDGIGLLLQGRMRHRIALLCSEENPSQCHRRLLVTRVLREHGVPVIHIRGDGTHQCEGDLAKRGGAERQPTLFGDDIELSWRSALPILRRPAKDLS